MFWLEPLVEVETPHGRIAYGPVIARICAGPFRRRIPRGQTASRFASAPPKRFLT